MSVEKNPSPLSGELRVALGDLMRRLRAEHSFSLSQGAVLGRLDREGPRSIGELANAERVRPQSMAQTVKDLEVNGLVARRADPADARRALVRLTTDGRSILAADRRQREGWLAEAIAQKLRADEQAVLADAVELLRRLANG
jgi:DNA-binding MarR family transcriptional regulator